MRTEPPLDRPQLSGRWRELYALAVEELRFAPADRASAVAPDETLEQCAAALR